jgi:tellurite resistance-related uncharacterized protein
VERPIVGFRRDDVGDWVALLDCGHGQHVRHQPPFVERPWVTTEEGRTGRLGLPLDCVRCDRFELPPHFVVYKQTPVFTETTIPLGLRADHATKAGVWAKIVVDDGTLRYHVDGLDTVTTLSPSTPGIVVPELKHHVEPIGRVRFHVEFHRAPEPA